MVTASNRAAAGVYADRSGPIIVDWLREHGFETPDPAVVPDGEPVGAALRAAVADGVDVVITPGGTGVAGRTLVVNLPGSAGGVRDGRSVLADVLEHAVDQVRGSDHR